jgi:hypothetical protein
MLMQEITLGTELADLAARNDACGGVLDIVFLDSDFAARG